MGGASATLGNPAAKFRACHAKLLAQANQAGSGNEAQVNELSTRNPLQSDNVSDQQEQMPMQQEQSALQHEAITLYVNKWMS